MEQHKTVDIPAFLKRQGYTTLPSDWYDKIEEWRSWYKGKVDSFHKYTQYNGITQVPRTRATLGMAKKLCEDKADLLLNDRCSITVDGGAAAQEFLDRVLDSTSFWVRGNQLVELMAAMGSAAFVEYISKGKIQIDCIAAPMCYPLSWSNGEITESAFASDINTAEAGRLTYINTHTIDPATGFYIVRNFFFDDKGTRVAAPKGVQDEWNTMSTIPLFQYIKLNAVNSYDINNPMGMAVFANAIDTLKSLDLIFDSYANEFRLGKKRIFVKDDVVTVRQGADGMPHTVPVFDSNDVEFYALTMDDKDGPIKEVNMTLRAAEHETALQRHLDLLSEKCGFGKGYYQSSADSVQTATGVISQNSQLYRRIRKDELVLEQALKQLTTAIFYLGGTVLKQSVGQPTEIAVNFDDSIVEDTDALAKRCLLEKQNGILSGKRYLMNVYGVTDEAAKKVIAEAQAEATEQEPPDDGSSLFPPTGSGGESGAE